MLYRLQLPLETPIISVHDMIIARMQESDYRYDLTRLESTGSRPEDNVCLLVLKLRNKGVRRNGQVNLIRGQIPPDLTLGEMKEMVEFSHPEHLVEVCDGVPYWAIYFNVACSPMPASLPGQTWTGSPFAHTCISRYFYSTFPCDVGRPSQRQLRTYSAMEGDECEGCAEAELAETVPVTPADTEVIEVEHPEPPSLLRRAGLLNTRSSNAAARSGSSPPSFAAYMPTSLWDRVWDSTPEPSLRIEASQNVGTFAARVFQAASVGTTPIPLVVQGEDLTQLVSKWKGLLVDAVERGDFTQVLSPRRSFVIANRAAVPGGTIRSIGPGIEREVLTATWAEYESRPARFLAPRLDDNWSLASTPFVSLTTVPQRRVDLAVLGATVAISIAAGVVPSPLSPVFLHYCLHNCDFASITPSVLKEWHPQFAAMLEDWKQTGASGSLDRFKYWVALYLDIDIATLEDRDQQTHDSAAAMMLYRAVLGSEGPRHADLRSFLRGFYLPCRNGFDFVEAVHSFRGGSEYLFTDLWSNRITGPQSLQGILDIRVFASVPRNKRALQLDGQFVSLQDVVQGFLRGTGVPIQSDYEDWSPTVHHTVDLALIGEPQFRPKMFHRAATGYQSIQSDKTISVCFVWDGDFIYPGEPGDDGRRINLAEGRVAWRTCVGAVIIPASHIFRLVTANAEQPAKLRAAIHNWLLRETLTCIGYHGIL
ncbi:hypothetical protein BV25DRAFT_1922452 [Artomyces pyxidatus]|uniref:Uncharacterized protein n=1 Tax=Artomyces pyxidatus TaxID=48021 RepID=A0ACB8SFJ5_9AGAM|nr:hypothetical protein BV25DRAFT_1922452 [Artomyces pyxidatus]